MRLLFLILLTTSACILERRIDQVFADHGVTWEPDSTSTDSTPSAHSSTSSGTSSTADSTSSALDTSTTSSDTPDASTTDASTTTPPLITTTSETATAGPTCGDGIVEADETCDDANDDPADGCNACVRESLMFVSSELFQAKALNGLFGADQWCRHLAAKAGLRNFAKFKAWLSSTQESAADRLFHSPGRYVLVNGLIVADDWTELTSGMIKRPIDVTEYSQTYHGTVWTGTLPDGTAAPGSTACEDWTANGLILGGFGATLYKDAIWTFYDNTTCSAESPIYCIEQ